MEWPGACSLLPLSNPGDSETAYSYIIRQEAQRRSTIDPIHPANNIAPVDLGSPWLPALLWSDLIELCCFPGYLLSLEPRVCDHSRLIMLLQFEALGTSTAAGAKTNEVDSVNFVFTAHPQLHCYLDLNGSGQNTPSSS